MSDTPIGDGGPGGRAPALRTLAMPADTNPAGDIFGGWLMAQMDLAAGTFASQIARGRVATVASEAMSFHRPVLVGDLVSCYCELRHVGRTSMSVQVQTWVRRFRSMADDGRIDEIKVTEGVFTFVALDAGGSKRVLPDDLRHGATTG